MKIFISWSGERSNTFAKALKDWLPDVLQDVEPWMSQHDIAAGSRWHSQIAGALENASFGILCVTPENQEAPWLIFEAGALSRSINQAAVVPIIIGMGPADLKSPLSQFQLVENDKSGILKLLNSINQALPSKLPAERIQRIFETWWPFLEKTTNALINPPEGTTPPPQRTEREMIEELLELARATNKQSVSRERDLFSFDRAEGYVTFDYSAFKNDSSVHEYRVCDDTPVDQVIGNIETYAGIAPEEAYSYGKTWAILSTPHIPGMRSNILKAIEDGAPYAVSLADIDIRNGMHFRAIPIKHRKTLPFRTIKV